MTVKKPQYTSQTVRALFCLDSMEGYDYKGRLYIGMEKRGFAVSGIRDFVTILENVFDYCNFPQAFLELRSFSKGKKDISTGGKMMEDKRLPAEENPKGKEATFIVQVQYRQNATWQGTVQWVEKEKTQRFRSELELMKLMNEAIESAEEVTWSHTESI